jgi:tRNA dimethylallyltransferase
MDTKISKDRFQNITAIVGPTASGKSALAVEMAIKDNAEIISADSRQVYKGLDLGSGKITKDEMKGIRHHMLDVADPKDIYTVAQYKIDAEKCIEDILSRGKKVIICGGSGLYIQAIADGLSYPSVPPNTLLRKKLSLLNTLELAEILKKLDKKRYEKIDQKNPVRLIRAIEIAEAIGFVPDVVTDKKYEISYIGLSKTPEELRDNIKNRLVQRLKDGMVEEVIHLKKSGLSHERMLSLGLEYKYISMYLEGEMDKERMFDLILLKSQQFAKRQLTWFKRNKSIRWK